MIDRESERLSVLCLQILQSSRTDYFVGSVFWFSEFYVKPKNRTCENSRRQNPVICKQDTENLFVNQFELAPVTYVITSPTEGGSY